jgi:hypothetical protein
MMPHMIDSESFCRWKNIYYVDEASSQAIEYFPIENRIMRCFMNDDKSGMVEKRAKAIGYYQ